MLTSLAPFLLEGDRILSMLTGPEILRLYSMISLAGYEIEGV